MRHISASIACGGSRSNCRAADGAIKWPIPRAPFLIGANNKLTTFTARPQAHHRAAPRDWFVEQKTAAREPMAPGRQVLYGLSTVPGELCDGVNVKTARENAKTRRREGTRRNP